MKLLIGVAAVAALALSGCGKKMAFDSSEESNSHGRYVGVGHFTPGQIWSQIAHAAQSKDDSASRLKDDEQIIVVMDSETGEVRQCGNMSGVCVAMNPWTKPVATSETTPVLISKHSEQLQAETANATSEPKSK